MGGRRVRRCGRENLRGTGAFVARHHAGSQAIENTGERVRDRKGCGIWTQPRIQSPESPTERITRFSESMRAITSGPTALAKQSSACKVLSMSCHERPRRNARLTMASAHGSQRSGSDPEAELSKDAVKNDAERIRQFPHLSTEFCAQTAHVKSKKHPSTKVNLPDVANNSENVLFLWVSI